MFVDRDNGYSPTLDVTRYDALDRIIGILKEARKNAVIQLINPLRWISFILQIPFLLIKQTGFNTDKIENELIGKTFKLLFLLAITWGLLKQGFSHSEIANFLTLKPF